MTRASTRDTIRLARPATRGLVLSTLLGAACIASAIGLLGTSAWLISRCAQHGSVADLGLAVVSVRFFALARGLFRYGERLVGHDGAFRALADLRVTVYERLERITPSGLRSFHRGDLLDRVVEDVDALQDVGLRVLPAWCIAGVVGVATTIALWIMLPMAAVVVAIALVVGAVVVPWLSRASAHRNEARRAPARGELTASVVDLLEGAPDLVAFGAVDAQVQRVVDHDRELTRVAAASAHTTGVGAGLIVLCMGTAMWAALVLGVGAVHTGRLDGVLLAVVALIPLAAFELVAALPVAAQALEGAQRSAARLSAVLDQPASVSEPPAPKPIRPGAHHDLRVRGLRVRHAPDSPWAVDGVDLDLSAGRRVAIVGAERRRQVDARRGARALRRLRVGFGATRRHRAARASTATRCGRSSASSSKTRTSSTRRCARTCASRADRLRRTRSWRRCRGRRLSTGSRAFPSGSTPQSASTARRLSGGQRQRLALARALLADFPILVLDEPGEHLDVETADALTRDLLSATTGRTTLLITHRLAGLDVVDEIVVLDRRSGRRARRTPK